VEGEEIEGERWLEVEGEVDAWDPHVIEKKQECFSLYRRYVFVYNLTMGPDV